MTRRPLVVLVTGEPGSGKTTLGVEVARALRMPFLARDDVRGGLYATAGEVPPADDAVEAFLSIVESMAGLGVSCVAEYVFRDARPGDLDRITGAARCVVIRTRCADAPARRSARDLADPFLQRLPAWDPVETAARMAAVTATMRTNFDLPVLDVTTDAGNDPTLDRIVQWVLVLAGGD